MRFQTTNPLDAVVAMRATPSLNVVFALMLGQGLNSYQMGERHQSTRLDTPFAGFNTGR